MISHGRLALLLSACLLGMIGCSDQLPWQSNWKIAMAEAHRDRLPAFVMFSAALCPHCWEMDRKVFREPRVREELEGYKLVRLDITIHRKMAQEYGFTGTPSFVVLTSTGRVLSKHPGKLDAAGLVRFIQRSRLNR